MNLKVISERCWTIEENSGILLSLLEHKNLDDISQFDKINEEAQESDIETSQLTK